MNYQRIYDNLIERARNRTPDGYTEKHHINPDFLFINRKRKGPKGHLDGDPNAPSNIVRLYPREHFIAHLLLVKIFKGTRYSYQAQSALMFFAKVASSHPRQNNFKITSYEYELARKIGLNGISKARKGTMPCVDVETGESVGSCSTTHPNVLSGKWVHHSKGNITIKEISTGKRQKVNTQIARELVSSGLYEYASSSPLYGSNNGNYKELTPELKEYIFDCIERTVVIGHIIRKRLIEEINAEISSFGIRKISYVFFRNKFGSIQNMVSQYNEARNKQINYDPYLRGYR